MTGPSAADAVPRLSDEEATAARGLYEALHHRAPAVFSALSTGRPLAMTAGDELAGLARLGLVVVGADGAVRSPFLVTRWFRLWYLTDPADARRPDAVFPPHAATRHFLTQLQVRPGDEALDLGTGGGMLALEAARRGARVAGLDNSERALAFARLNAALNGLEARFFTSDLEAPGTTATWGRPDVVVSHPPPSLPLADGSAQVTGRLFDHLRDWGHRPRVVQLLLVSLGHSLTGEPDPAEARLPDGLQLRDALEALARGLGGQFQVRELFRPMSLEDYTPETCVGAVERWRQAQRADGWRCVHFFLATVHPLGPGGIYWVEHVQALPRTYAADARWWHAAQGDWTETARGLKTLLQGDLRDACHDVEGVVASFGATEPGSRATWSALKASGRNMAERVETSQTRFVDEDVQRMLQRCSAPADDLATAVSLAKLKAFLYRSTGQLYLFDLLDHLGSRADEPRGARHRVSIEGQEGADLALAPLVAERFKWYLSDDTAVAAVFRGLAEGRQVSHRVSPRSGVYELRVEDPTPRPHVELGKLLWGGGNTQQLVAALRLLFSGGDVALQVVAPREGLPELATTFAASSAAGALFMVVRPVSSATGEFQVSFIGFRRFSSERQTAADNRDQRRRTLWVIDDDEARVEALQERLSGHPTRDALEVRVVSERDQALAAVNEVAHGDVVTLDSQLRVGRSSLDGEAGLQVAARLRVRGVRCHILWHSDLVPDGLAQLGVRALPFQDLVAALGDLPPDAPVSPSAASAARRLLRRSPPDTFPFPALAALDFLCHGYLARLAGPSALPCLGTGSIRASVGPPERLVSPEFDGSGWFDAAVRSLLEAAPAPGDWENLSHRVLRKSAVDSLVEELGTEPPSIEAAASATARLCAHLLRNAGRAAEAARLTSGDPDDDGVAELTALVRAAHAGLHVLWYSDPGGREDAVGGGV